MISYQEAIQHVLAVKPELHTEIIPITNGLGRVLMENIYADRDFPPFDRVSMDGIAIQCSENTIEKQVWKVEGTQYAGEKRLSLQNNLKCIEVMTGAPLPAGTDTVVRYEDLNEEPKGNFIRNVSTIERGQNIHRRGADKKAGELILQEGKLLCPADIAIIASVGKSVIEVLCQPRVCILNTGNELFDVHETPPAYGIRASNGYLIAAALAGISIKTEVSIIGDDYESLKKTLQEKLAQHELLIITGAVSKGKADFIPELLTQMGVQQIFHGVAQRPAKPLWFGKNNRNVVFAMPGNPVSATVCTYVYLLPWLGQLMQLKNHSQPMAILKEDVEFKPMLTYFLQVKIRIINDVLYANPIKGNGSGDFCNLALVDAFMMLPQHQSKFHQGECYPIFPIR